MPRKGQTKYNGLFSEGHKFGKWELLDSVPQRVNLPSKKKGRWQNTTYKYSCRCECGTEDLVDCRNLEKGISTCCVDCGNAKNKGEGNGFWKGHRGLGAKYLGRLKNGATKRNLDFDLTADQLCDLYEQQNETCALSGLPITLNENASVDRIDNDGNYTIDNIQWVHKDVNFMKRTYSQEYFIDMCSKIAANSNLTEPKN